MKYLIKGWPRHLKIFSDEIGSNIKNVIVLYSVRMCADNLDDVQISANQYSKWSVHITKTCKSKTPSSNKTDQWTLI